MDDTEWIDEAAEQAAREAAIQLVKQNKKEAAEARQERARQLEETKQRIAEEQEAEFARKYPEEAAARAKEKAEAEQARLAAAKAAEDKAAEVLDDWKKNAFAGLDFTYEDAVAAEEKLLRDGPSTQRDKRVCLCGHPISRHTSIAGLVMCKPTRMDCPCKKVRAVLTVQDTRVFLRKTEGSGVLHALGRGMKASVEANKTFEWISPPSCDRCEKVGHVTPCAVTQRGVIVQMPTGFDALLCQSCRLGA